MILTTFKGLIAIVGIIIFTYILFIACGFMYVLISNIFSNTTHIAHNYRNYKDHGYSGFMFLFMTLAILYAAYIIGSAIK